jgi:hypothetical protein
MRRMPTTRPATRRGFCLPQRRMPRPLVSIQAKRAYAPPFAGAVIVKQVLSQLHPGQRRLHVEFFANRKGCGTQQIAQIRQTEFFALRNGILEQPAQRVQSRSSRHVLDHLSSPFFSSPPFLSSSAICF